MAAGEWWRLTTAPFVSGAGWPHALLNVAGILILTRPLERQYGSRVAATVLITSAVTAFAAGVWGHGTHWLHAGGSGAVLGCAGFLALRWREIPGDARLGLLVATTVTFGEPVVSTLLGQPLLGSLPAHAGGFVAGAMVAALHTAGVRGAVTVAVALAGVVASLAPLAIPLLPEQPELIACESPVVSRRRRGYDTRLLFLNPSERDVAVRWVRPEGTAGRSFRFAPERRGRMPWYGYSGAVYEVVDDAEACITRAVATRATSTVVVPAAD